LAVQKATIIPKGVLLLSVVVGVSILLLQAHNNVAKLTAVFAFTFSQYAIAIALPRTLSHVYVKRLMTIAKSISAIPHHHIVIMQSENADLVSVWTPTWQPSTLYRATVVQHYALTVKHTVRNTPKQQEHVWNVWRVIPGDLRLSKQLRNAA
jgi:hypothetical protein